MPEPHRDFDQIGLTGWYPIHMLRTGRDLQAQLKLVDLVVELLDARVPGTSRNPAFTELLGQKQRFLLFAKADLAAPEGNRAWQQAMARDGQDAFFADLRSQGAVSRLPQLLADAVARGRKARGATRPLNRPVRVMIAGIPNVGKSTLVNRLSAGKRAKVGPRPGVTRHHQWVTLKGGLELLDTPGVLWPRLDSKTLELRLTVVGAIPDDLVGEEMVAEYLLELLRHRAAHSVWARYELEHAPIGVDELLERVARRRGLLQSGAVPDMRRSAVAFLKDFRDGHLGRYTFDEPEG
jgi:ribosome biogenesis GTPase A